MNFKTISLSLIAILLMACNAKKQLSDTIYTVPETEYRDLDTLVVTAPKPDEFKEPEEFRLPLYNPSHTRINDLLHTKLDLTFDWANEKVIGKATLKLKPHFYPTQKLTLDAKNFIFNKVEFESGVALKYEYDGKQIIIDLGKAYNRKEEYTIFIDYIASPSEEGGSAAITSDKGLFFINPRGEEAEKPQQIWTQGETENNSRWFPTIDKPNERTTQEMYLTVEDRFKTLSNGVLVSSNKNTDGTRTDYWKMDLPHAPYLFMITVGEFAVVSEDWKGKLVEYYVEPEFEEYARRIFPHTPEMLGFFSDKLGLEYPWQKYSQVVVRDYVSGAMENTTGVIFGEFMQGTEQDLLDDMTNDKIVAHEMFHHWFGDLVTCESWANLTMNEGFANYSEYMWMEHKYGKDEADFHLLNELKGYLSSARNGIHPLIHFGHLDKEDMFDAHSYNKGGLVLHMLRDYVGDDAFFSALNKYLSDNQYSDVEAHELRLAFEDVTGEDLNWFFDQWYFEAGHPDLTIDYDYDDIAKNVKVIVEQTQNPSKQPAIFQLPVTIDIYLPNGDVEAKEVMINDRKEVFSFEVNDRPKLVNFDAKKLLLIDKTDNKTEEELAYQYLNAPRFLDRFEALDQLKGSQKENAKAVFQKGLTDNHWVLRAIALGNVEINADTESTIVEMAKNDKHSSVRQSAIAVLANSGDAKYTDIAKNAIKNDPSFDVRGTALEALIAMDQEAALVAAKDLESSKNPQILGAVGEIYAQSGEAKYLPFFENNWEKLGGFSAISFIENYALLAVQTDAKTMLTSAGELEKIALNMQRSPWSRYAAVNGINSLHGALVQFAENAEGATKTELENTDKAIVKIIERVKGAEENARLKSMYGKFPNPAVKP